jgi:DMSO/TMAO reductase YedYZ heme-binding membrane subunit
VISANLNQPLKNNTQFLEKILCQKATRLRENMKIARDNGYGLAKQSLLPWVAATLIANTALLLGLFLQPPATETSRQLWARYTARLSFFLFLAAYLASPLYELAQNRVTDWLRRHRRNSGISFGIAHIIHLVALVAFTIISNRETALATIIVGGGAYVAMFIMLASSNDAAIRRMGHVNWRRLHKFSAHYLAFVFVYTYTAGYLAGFGAPLVLILLGWAAIVLRIGVSLKARGEKKT